MMHIKYIALIALTALSFTAPAQNQPVFIRNYHLGSLPLKDMLVSPDGLRWVFKSNQNPSKTESSINPIILTQDYMPLFNPNEKQRRSAFSNYFYFPVNFVVSPNLKFIAGNKMVSKTSPNYDNKAKKFKSVLRYFPDSVQYTSVTVPLAQFEDKHYVIGVTDNGKMITTQVSTEIAFNEVGHKVEKASKYTNLYLLDPQTEESTTLFTGKIWEEKFPRENQPEVFMNTRNTLLAIPINWHKKMLMVDLVSNKSIFIDLPEKVGEAQIDYRFAEAFFIDSHNMLCLRAKSFQFTPNGTVHNNIILGFGANSNKHRFVQFFLRGDVKYEEEFSMLNNILYYFDPRNMEVRSYHFENNQFVQAGMSKLDTTGLKIHHLPSYNKQLMQTPEGMMLALMPNEPVLDQYTPMYFMDLSSGKAAYEIMLYSPLISAGRAAAAGMAVEGSAMMGDRCSEKKAEAQKHYLDIVMGWDGQNRYVLDFDCSKSQYVVARLAHEDILGEPGNFRNEPYNYILPELMSVSDFNSRTKTKTGLKLCPECHGRPLGVHTTSSSSWTWKPVLGLTWYVQTEVTTKTKHAVLCSYCKGQALIK